MLSFQLLDKSQSTDLIIELLFELTCQTAKTNELLMRSMSQGDEELAMDISSYLVESESTFREILVRDIASRFQIEPYPAQ